MYELHIGNKNYSSWSLRPWLLLRQLGIPFSERLHRFGSDNATAFKQFSPTAKVPCLVDVGRVVWDSLAIAEYLAERHTGVWPADVEARTWARCAAAEMHSGFAVLRDLHGMNVGVRVAVTERSERLRADIARIEELWNQGLARFGGPYLAGAELSAVDAFYAPVAFRCQTYGVEIGGAAAAYLQRLLALPAMRAWEADALAEDFRDAAHEAEAALAGQVVRDLRTPAA